jgi:hypothetical protein
MFREKKGMGAFTFATDQHKSISLVSVSRNFYDAPLVFEKGVFS